MEVNKQMSLTNNDLLSLVHKLVDPDLKECFPEEYRNKSPLDSLDDARSWLTPMYDPDDGSRYGELVDELDSLYNNILQLFPVDKQIDFFDAISKYCNCLVEISTLERSNLYKIGLRDGFLLAVELLALQGKNMAANRIGLGETIGGLGKSL